MGQIGQLVRVSFSIQNRLNDGQACMAADVADHIGQLHVHLGENLLHPLNERAG
jgi:hypothetical protein